MALTDLPPAVESILNYAMTMERVDLDDAPEIGDE